MVEHVGEDAHVRFDEADVGGVEVRVEALREAELGRLGGNRVGAVGQDGRS